MYGLQAINEANGWAISIAGAGIVFTGLVVLATLIANLERALNLWDRKQDLFEFVKKTIRKPKPLEPEPEPLVQPRKIAPPSRFEVIELSPEKQEIASYFEMIVRRIGEPFSLVRLLEHAERLGVPRPHSNLAIFLTLGLVEEDKGECPGFYRWKKNVQIATEQSNASN